MTEYGDFLSGTNTFPNTFLEGNIYKKEKEKSQGQVNGLRQLTHQLPGRKCWKKSVKNTHTSPKSKDEFGDIEPSKSETFKDDLARLGAWWAGIPRAVASDLFPNMQVPPQFLIGWVLSLRSPKFIISLLGIFLPFPTYICIFQQRVFLLVYPFPQHLVCLGTLHVHELCVRSPSP